MLREFEYQIDADRFTAIRLQMGCYGQRQEGVIGIVAGRLKERFEVATLDGFGQFDRAALCAAGIVSTSKA